MRDDDEEGTSLADALGGLDHGFRLAEHRALLGAVLGELDDRDREILRLRFEEDLTQHEIAAIVGVSQMQVSRLLRRSLNVLRMRGRAPPRARRRRLEVRQAMTASAAAADRPAPAPSRPAGTPRSPAARSPGGA